MCCEQTATRSPSEFPRNSRLFRLFRLPSRTKNTSSNQDHIPFKLTGTGMNITSKQHKLFRRPSANLLKIPQLQPNTPLAPCD